MFALMVHNFSYQFITKNILLSGGENIFYIDEGGGEQTLFFIHGLANNALSWQMNIEKLKQHFRCVAIDLPGNGFSTMIKEVYSMHYFASIILEVIEKLKLKNVVLCGHSMGGQIAITTALLQPLEIQGLLLCAPAGLEYFSPFEISIYKSGINFLDFFSTEENSLTKLIRSSFYHNTHQADVMINDLIELMHRQPAGQYRKMIEGCIDAMLQETVYERLHLIQQQTVVIFGERDVLIPNRFIHPITTKQFAESIVKKIKLHHLHLISSAGHFIHWEKASEVNDIIIETFKK
jgi:pimeloyl-ACP methyl ester carboxylesterase